MNSQEMRRRFAELKTGQPQPEPPKPRLDPVGSSDAGRRSPSGPDEPDMNELLRIAAGYGGDQ